MLHEQVYLSKSYWCLGFEHLATRRGSALIEGREQMMIERRDRSIMSIVFNLKRILIGDLDSDYISRGPREE